jgi:putative ABC transport system permease protein
MNIVNKLTLRHLKQNKRRTLVTIIGVIISVAMITAVATLFVSFLDLMQRQEIDKNGEWHVVYNNVNKEQLNVIKNDKDTKKVIISRDVGYAILKGGQNEYKPYLFIKEYNDQGFNHFPIELTKGRLPKAGNEVVLSEHIATNAKVEYKFGDRLSLEVGDRTMTKGEGPLVTFDQNSPLQGENGKSAETLKVKGTKLYTVVGFIKRPIWEPTWAPGYTILSYVDESMMGAIDRVNATVVLKKVNNSLYNHAKNLAKKNKIKSVAFNSALLRYYGVTSNAGLSRTLFSLSAIIMAVIIIGSVSLIYNAFAISVSERSRHLGMLASVGATKRQKRNSVFFEGAIIGLISIPLGILCGLGGIGITFLFINSILQSALGIEEKLALTVTPFSIIVACAVSMMTIFISTYIPAKKASKISAIDAIRQTPEIKLTGKTVRTSKLVRRLFGFEAEIGLKNLKRNKRRYKATVFSLVISIVLFLSVSFFTTNLKKSLALSQEEVRYDIQVFLDGKKTNADESLLKSFASLENVTKSTETKTLYAESWMDKASVADEFQNEMYKDNFKNGKMSYFINLYTLNPESLKAYAKEVGIEYKKLTDRNQLSGIVIDTTSYKDSKTKKITETKAIYKKVGQGIDLIYKNLESEKETKLNKVTIAGLTDVLPIGVSPSGLGGLNIIVSESVMGKLIKDCPDAEVRSYLYLNSKDPMNTQQEIEKLKTGNMSVYNEYQNKKQQEQMIVLMSVFTYGFIALITAISVANIFNTISTSISLRKREFAMLKSVGMTPKGFNKMINYESIFYGIKSLFYGFPISLGVMYLIYMAMMNAFSYRFAIPWFYILYCFTAVFLIVCSAMLYSISKVKKENIIDALKQESI